MSNEKRVLCHRDYHSRNLMLHDGSLYIIDFQDARMGPDTYDLVSLLRDSYVDLTPQQVDELIAFFLALNGQSTHDEEFRRRFDLMAVQRNLKALGTFGYMTTSRNNTVYIQYIPRTLAHVKTNLAKYPRFERLRACWIRGYDRRLRIRGHCVSFAATMFGISTHLYISERLDRDHLVEIAAHGFEAIELFALARTLRLPRSARRRRARRMARRHPARLHSMHAPIAGPMRRERGKTA